MTGIVAVMTIFVEQFGMLPLAQGGKLTKGRQIPEIPKSELLQEDLGRAVQDRAAGNILAPDDADEFLVKQRS